MALTVIPTNIGGFNLPFAQLQGPLSALFQNQNPKNLVFPSDLGTNPAMGHAVQFEIFDYTSGFVDKAKNVLAAVNDVGLPKPGSDLKAFATNAAGKLGGPTAEFGVAAITASSYQPVKKNSLANISLYMPDTLNISYNSNYTEVSLTESLGLKGFLGGAITDSGAMNAANLSDSVQTILKSEYAKGGAIAGGAALAGKVLGKDLGGVISQAAGVFINPQIQLLYKGIALRTFQLEFIFTPKTAQEAQVAKDVCDSFTFYSLPGLAGAAGGNSGQFLKPPQIFSIKFKFLGKNGILGAIGNVFQSALNNAGLGFLNSMNPTGTITNGAPAKIMTLSDCVLENVNIDYAPNGWAAYNDGYPIQTRLTLQFKEIKMQTKENVNNTKIQNNYNGQQAESDRVERVYAPKDPAYNDAGY
jgi:hypothetical protein